MKQGEQLQDAIKLARLTVQQAHKGLGVSRSTLFNYYKMEELERDVRDKAAKLLGKPVDKIFRSELDESPNVQKDTDITRLLIDLISKQTALIERQGAKDEKLIQTADTAITLANEVRGEIKGLSSSVTRLEEKTEGNRDALTALQRWVSGTLAPVVKKTSTQVVADLLRIEREAQKQRIADSQPVSDKPRKSKAKSHQL